MLEQSAPEVWPLWYRPMLEQNMLEYLPGGSPHRINSGRTGFCGKDATLAQVKDFSSYSSSLLAIGNKLH